MSELLNLTDTPPPILSPHPSPDLTTSSPSTLLATLLVLSLFRDQEQETL